MNGREYCRDLLLLVGFRGLPAQANVDEGFARLQAIVGVPLDYSAFRDALDAALRDGLIREPVRLPEGSLQCHWKLELTPRGVEATRALLRERGMTADELLDHLRKQD